jgi:hypothetical protein
MVERPLRNCEPGPLVCHAAGAGTHMAGMGTDASATEDGLSELTVEELRARAREEGIPGVADMRKDELVRSLERSGTGSPAAREGARAWVRDRSLGLLFVSLFLVSWVAQLFFEWKVFANEQAEHGTEAVFWSASFWETFWQSTLENWQSEFLQLATFAIAAAYLVFKGSSESPDSSERMEHKLDALLRQQGLDPAALDRELPPKYQKTR